nr:hypothetical protein [Tanacetum cinerariifolium]
MPKVLLLAWDRVSEIKDAFGNKQCKLVDIQELFRKLFNDVQNILEKFVEYINTLSWNRPIVYYDDDEEDYIIAITPVLSTEEPDFFDSNDDSTSIDDDDFFIDDIDYVEASPPDSELVSLEEVKDFDPEDGEIDIDILLTIKDNILHEKLLNINLLIAKIEALKDNPTPSTNSVLNEPDSRDFTMDVVEDIFDNPTREPRVHVPDVLPTHPTFHLDLDFTLSSDSLGSDLVVSFPSGTRNKIFDPGIFFKVQSKNFLSRNTFYISFIRDPLCLVIETLLPFSSENEEQVFNPSILSSNLLSHRGKITFDFSENPMMIFEGDIPFLDVLNGICKLNETIAIAFIINNFEITLTLEEFARILKIPCQGVCLFTPDWPISSLQLVVDPHPDIYPPRHEDPYWIRNALFYERTQPKTRKMKGVDTILDPFQMIFFELKIEFKKWEVILSENAISLIENKDHPNACLCYMLYCLAIGKPFKLAYYIAKRMVSVTKSADMTLPYGMLLTRLFEHVHVNHRYSFSNEFYLVDHVMIPLSDKRVFRFKDNGKRPRLLTPTPPDTESSILLP